MSIQPTDQQSAVMAGFSRVPPCTLYLVLQNVEPLMRIANATMAAKNGSPFRKSRFARRRLRVVADSAPAALIPGRFAQGSGLSFYFQSSHRGGGGPGPLSFSLSLRCFVVFIEPAPILKAEPSKPVTSRTANLIPPVTSPVAGRSTLAGFPPAMWLRASKMTTIKPSDQSRSISLIVCQSRPLC
mgnify:CR=1 FL=1